MRSNHKMLIGYLRALRWAQWEILVRIGGLSGGTGWSVVSSENLAWGCWWKTWGWKDKAPLWLPCALVSQVMGVQGQWVYDKGSESPKRRHIISSWGYMFSFHTLIFLLLGFYHLVIWQRECELKTETELPDCWTSSLFGSGHEILVKKYERSRTGESKG